MTHPSFSNLLFGLPFLFLLLAQEKILLGSLPLYSLEIASIPVFGYALWRFLVSDEKLSSLFSADKLLSLGVFLALSGAALSFFVNPFSLTGLGMLKSWFFFPAFLFFAGISMRKELSAERLLIFWLLGTLFVAVAAFLGIREGIYTFDQRLAFPYSSPNFLAILLLSGILIASAFGTRYFRTKKGLSWLFFLAALLLLVPFIETRSYGAWAALSGAFVWLLSSRSSASGLRKTLAAALLLAAVSTTAFFFSESGTGKWQSLVHFDERSSLSSREMIWKASFAILGDSPFFGIGVGRFQETYLEYQRHFPPYLEWAVPEPHNLILAFWFGTGIIGLSGFLLVIGRSLFLLWRILPERKDLASLALSLWGALLLFGLLDTPYFRNDLAFLFWMLVLLSFLVQQKLPLTEERTFVGEKKRG
ncbi:MAG: hypothetical protein A2808_03590 [Candidatus Moranbacteria bacterium RIFCSPHIGHO2_01_FULL_55_24]|nr:MAG: hypothetical protein A2808_03590 [Candidatus Moranbacteria bacterium RIFCSPHIGHO2_01_FULL_55_24]